MLTVQKNEWMNPLTKEDLTTHDMKKLFRTVLDRK